MHRQSGSGHLEGETTLEVGFEFDQEFDMIWETLLAMSIVQIATLSKVAPGVIEADIRPN